MVNPQAEAAKKEGNKHFTSGRFQQAIEHYSQAIDLDPDQHTFYSNRSASYAGLERWSEAESDARDCIRVNKSFVKGYYRLALALQKQGRFDEAVTALKTGLTVDPHNRDLRNMQRDCEESQRMERVDDFLSQAHQQHDSGDLAAAKRSLENALRLDSSNEAARELMNIVRPQYESQEKSRVARLSPVELFKEEGDTCYKNANFEGAIEKYSQCLDQLNDRTSELATKCLSNRSACYKQLSNFDAVISDCTEVLEVQPENVKALVRRAQAFEALERYRLALQDVRYVLQMPYETVGQATYQLANGMQHRLNRVVQQLKVANS